jgi:hypothetical protein
MVAEKKKFGLEVAVCHLALTFFCVVIMCSIRYDTIRYGDVAGWAVLSKLFVICAADDVYMIYEYLNLLQACFIHVSKS